LVNELLQKLNIEAFQQDLLSWYEKNKRELPWRETADPYHIWVSEIMLQQTKVDTVIPYFNRFMEKYPTLDALAAADEEEVLKSWEGLGYYSRARNLHTAVKEVAASYSSEVPDTKEELGKLKGIGPYTKGAILSIAFDQPEPAVDGNVMRVFSRLLLINDDIARARTKTVFEKIVREVISREDPSSFNQAIMDLGATICTPKSPACLICPVQEHCQAYETGAEEELPVKTKAKKQRTIRYAALVAKNQEGEYLVEKRPEAGLLANMYQFPMVPLEEAGEDIPGWVKDTYDVRLSLGKKEGELQHVFSHLIWDIQIYEADVLDEELRDGRLRFATMEEMKRLPFPVSHLRIRSNLE
jgi:A/G-specific adenine glycosylase